jgi:hypothetical protein
VIRNNPIFLNTLQCKLLGAKLVRLKTLRRNLAVFLNAHHHAIHDVSAFFSFI